MAPRHCSTRTLIICTLLGLLIAHTVDGQIPGYLPAMDYTDVVDRADVDDFADASRISPDILQRGPDFQTLDLGPYNDRLLKELASRSRIARLTEEIEAHSTPDKLRGLYSQLRKHPELMDRRLKAGSHIPSTKSEYKYDEHHEHHEEKRRHDYPPSWKRPMSLGIQQSACPAITQWQLLYWARDINDSLVEVYQPPGTRAEEGQQWFYSIRCDYNHRLRANNNCLSCCVGVDVKRYSSECVTKKSFVMALIRRKGQMYYDWDWIQVDSSCNCALTIHP